MTSRPFFAAVALGASAFSLSLAQSTSVPAAPAAPATATPEQIFECYGWVAGQESRLASFGLNDAEIAAFLRGLRSAAQGEPPPASFEAVRPVAEGFLNARVGEVRARQLEENRAEEEKLLASLDQNPAIKKTESGLRYEIVAPGADPKPALSDAVIAHYKGTFADGSEFDSSSGGQPAEFKLMEVVPAWQEGMQLIGTGGRIKLYVPSALGYGEFGSGGIPPGKALIFEVELVAIKPAAPELPSVPAPSLLP